MNDLIKQLDDAQLASFDTEYVCGGRWDAVKSLIDEDFPSGEFSFLDVGGGNGLFADRLLAEYPKATGTVLDNSELLLSRNQPNERKTTICDSIENLSLVNGKYDLVCMHWLLHHLVGHSYQRTRWNQLKSLQKLPGLLKPHGRVSVFENNCEGWLFKHLPGYLIYNVTSAKWLAPITRRMGANTAGVGICYRSKDQWLETMRDAGLKVLKFSEPQNWARPLRPEYRVFLHVGHIRVGHYWLTAPLGHSSPSSTPS